MQEVDFLQFIKGFVCQPDGNLALFGYLFGCIGLGVLFKALGYERHYQDGDKIAVAPADIARILVEAEVPDILSGVGQFGTEQADGPGYLQPQQKHRKGGKTTIDGIVTGNPQLAADVKELECLVCRTCQNTGYECLFQLDLCIRHKDVQCCKHEPGQHEGDEAHHKLADGSQQGKVFEVLHHRTHEDGKTTGHHQQNGHQQKHREVIRYFAVHAARLFHLPDAVEGDFHIVDQIQDCPQQHNQTHSDEYSTLGLRQIRIHELQDDFRGFRRTAETVDNLAFHQIIESETAGYGKQNGKNRHDGKQRTVSQRRGFVYYPVFGEAVDAKINRLDDIVYGKGRSRDFIFRNTPDVVGEEFPKGSNTLVHAIISIIHCQ